jgi:GNAT superfamily N-acetyltransferase
VNKLDQKSGKRSIDSSTLSTNDFRVRNLALEDIPGIISICQESFPDSLRWNLSMDIGWIWWKTILELDSVEKLVVSMKSEICGFCLLVIDIHKFARQKEILEINKSEVIKKLYKRPNLIFRQMNKRIKNYIEYQINKRKIFKAERYSKRDTGWIELIAISKLYRRKGLSKLLLNFSENILNEKGIRYVGSTIGTGNKASIAMHEKYGFVFKTYSKSGLIFLKHLN